MTGEKKILISEDNPLFDPIDDSYTFEIKERMKNGEFTTPEEFIEFLRSRHNLD